MKLFDIDSEKLYSLQELKSEYSQFNEADPVNHCDTFTVELYEIIMATINGRNNCDVCGMTPRELSGYIARLRAAIREA